MLVVCVPTLLLDGPGRVLPASSQTAQGLNMGGMQQVKRLYLDELHLSADSAFVTHGLCTFLVLVFGWASCCFAIDIIANNIESVRRSKIQPSRKTDDPELRKLAKQVVIRNWVTVLLQAVLGAPLLKAAFPSYKKETALGWSEFFIFFLCWFVSNDFLFTIFHRMFHESPFLYRLVHKEHHTWKAPFSWMSHAMSVYEMSANGIASTFWLFIHSLVLKRETTIELFWFIQLVAQLIGCIEHSGYNALYPLLIINPKSFPKWLFSTTKHHDTHHLKFKGNYGGYLQIWDVIMGTTIDDDDEEKKRKR